MKSAGRMFILIYVFLLIQPAMPSEDSTGVRRPLKITDMLESKSVRGTAISNNG